MRMLLWGIALLGVCSCFNAHAETVALKNGDELVGEIIARDQSTVVIKEYDSGRTRRVMRSAIDYISLNGAPDPNSKSKRADVKVKEETKVAEKKEEKKEGEGEKKEEAPKEGEKKEADKKEPGEKKEGDKKEEKETKEGEKKEADKKDSGEKKEGDKKEEKPADTKPAETKPAEVKPAETKPPEVPAVTPPGDKAKRKKLLQGQTAPKEEE